MGLVGHPIRPEIDATIEAERPVDPKNRLAAVRKRGPFGVSQIVKGHGGGTIRDAPPTGKEVLFAFTETGRT
jgi:hypothetical protein